MKTNYTEKQVKLMMETEGMTRQQAIAELEAICRINDREQEANYGQIINASL